jgi:hypothetical protein
MSVIISNHIIQIHCAVITLRWRGGWFSRQSPQRNAGQDRRSIAQITNFYERRVVDLNNDSSNPDAANIDGSAVEEGGGDESKQAVRWTMLMRSRRSVEREEELFLLSSAGDLCILPFHS